MPIVRTGEAGERLATIGHLDHRAARLLRALLQGRRALFHHQRRGTLSERFVEKAVPIGMHPAQSHKECLWHHVTGIRRQTLHRTTRGTHQYASLEAIEEVHQLTVRLQHKTSPMLRAAVPSQFSALSIRPHVPAHVRLTALPLTRRGAVARGPPAAVLGMGSGSSPGSASGSAETGPADNTGLVAPRA